MNPNAGGRPRGGVAGSQPRSTDVHRSPNNTLWRSNSIFSLGTMFKFVNTNTVEASAQNVRLSLLLDFYISPPVGGAGSIWY
jgi:hypothetical protein